MRQATGGLVLAMILVGLLAAGSANAAITLPSGFQQTTILGNLSRPAAVAWTPDGRMIMAMRDGPLKVLKSDGKVVTPYSVPANTYADHGFLGVAVDANYTSNHYVYLLYTYENNAKDYTGNNKVSVLERIQLSTQNVASDSQIILGQKLPSGSCPPPSNTNDCIPSESDSHSIGTVRSDPDGTLWVGSGDAADGDGVQPGAFRTNDPTSYAGKILHIDRNGQGLAGHSFCPGNNLGDVCTKVYAMGFRNPFRFTLRSGGQGPVVGDVGWNSYEELDLVQQGKDYGWPCWEGPIQTPSYKDDPRCNGRTSEAPVDSIPHTGAGLAIFAGPTYNGSMYPSSYRGKAFYGAYGVGLLRTFDPVANAATDFGSGNYGWIDLEAAPDNGDVVYVDFGDSQNGTGSIGRISYTAGNRTPVALAGATTPTAGPLPLSVGFRGDQSSDPDGDALTYDWNFGDGSAHSSAANPAHIYNAYGRFTATLTVNDGRGRSASNAITVNAGAPTVTIATPTGNSLYTDGVTEALQGSAVPTSSLAWHVILHHNTHIHDLGTFPGASTGFTPLVNHDADSYYDVTLNATDANGVIGSKTVTIRPRTVRLTLASDPPGAPVSYGGTSQTAPFAATSAVGYQTSISAADQFSSAGTTYPFARWSDGGGRLHDITIPSKDATLTAAYTGPPSPAVPTPPPAPAPPPAPVSALPPPTLPDRTGPSVSLALSASGLRHGRVSGTTSDPSNIKGVEIALRARSKRGGKCRWWSSRSRSLRPPSSCTRPRWMSAQLSPLRADHRTRPWAVKLRRALPPGRYVLLVRAVDGAGNSTSKVGKKTEISVRL